MRCMSTDTVTILAEAADRRPNETPVLYVPLKGTRGIMQRHRGTKSVYTEGKKSDIRIALKRELTF